MLNRDNLDLKIILSLTNTYENLYEKGEISGQQLDEVLTLIDNYQDYTPEHFQKEIENIF